MSKRFFYGVKLCKFQRFPGHPQADRARPPVPLAAPIDNIFAMPTKTAPLQGMVDSFAAAASTPSRFSSPQGRRSFSDPPMRNTLSSGIAEIGHRHVHGHGGTAMAQTATSPGDATVHKTEVVETVVETQSNQAAVAKQDTAQSSEAASQAVVASVDGVGGAGVSSIETAAAASQTAAAASSATAAKEEKVVKKTKKTTTTVVKKGSDATALGGVTAGNVQEVHQVVEETVHQGSATSVAAASESAAVSAQSSSGSTAVGGSSGGLSAAVASSASASNAASSASATETNNTTSVKKKVTTKTTKITKTKASDTGGLAGMNSELPKAVLSNLNKKQAAMKKPPTAILSDNNDKKKAIKSKAVLLATDKPKLAAPVITDKPVVVAETTTVKQQVSTEEVEIEAEEVVSSTTTNPNTATGYVPVPSYVYQSRTNSGYNVAGWSSSHTTEPPLGPNDRMNTTDVPEEIEARPDKTRAQRRQLLKRMNPGLTNQQIEAQLIRDDKARAKMAATQSKPDSVIQEQTNSVTKQHFGHKPEQAMLQKSKTKSIPIQKTRNFNLWSPLTANELKSFGPIFLSKASELSTGTGTRPARQSTISETARAQRRQLLKRMNPGFTNAQIEAQLIRDDKARAKMAATQSEPVVILPEPVTAPTKPPPVNPPKPKPKPQPKPKQTQPANKINLWQPTSAGKFGSIVKKPVQRHLGPKQGSQTNFNQGSNQQRTNPVRNTQRRRPRPTRPRPTTTEPIPTTYPPTYPPTTDFIPTTYPTPAYQYTDPIVSNHQRRRGPPPRRQRQMRRQQAPRRNNRPRPRPLGRRQRNRAKPDGEEFRPRDPLSRWIYNNIDGEVLDAFLPLFAFG